MVEPITVSVVQHRLGTIVKEMGEVARDRRYRSQGSSLAA